MILSDLKTISLFVCFTLAVLCADGELNVLEDILTEAPDHDDELYNPESERDVIDKKGTLYCLSGFALRKYGT